MGASEAGSSDKVAQVFHAMGHLGELLQRAWVWDCSVREGRLWLLCAKVLNGLSVSLLWRKMPVTQRREFIFKWMTQTSAKSQGEKWPQLLLSEHLAFFEANHIFFFTMFKYLLDWFRSPVWASWCQVVMKTDMWMCQVARRAEWGGHPEPSCMWGLISPRLASGPSSAHPAAYWSL